MLIDYLRSKLDERQQRRRVLLRTSLLVGVTGVSLVGVAAAFRLLARQPVGVLVRDATAQTGAPWYTGALSGAGVVLWGVTGVTALLAASLAGPRQQASRSALRALGAVALLFMLDDQLMLHEDVLPAWGIPEELVLLGYAVAVLLLCVRLAPAACGLTYMPTLVAGVLLLGLSVVVDQLPHYLVDFTGRATLEDVSKITGLACLAAFAFWTAQEHGRSRYRAYADDVEGG